MDKKWRVAVCLGLGIALTGAALAFQIVNRRISDIVSVDSEQIRQENRRSLQGGPLRLGPRLNRWPTRSLTSAAVFCCAVQSVNALVLTARSALARPGDAN
jgi:hypothetical protein